MKKENKNTQSVEMNGQLIKGQSFKQVGSSGHYEPIENGSFSSRIDKINRGVIIVSSERLVGQWSFMFTKKGIQKDEEEIG